VAHGVVISKKEKKKNLARIEPATTSATYRLTRLPSYPLGQDRRCPSSKIAKFKESYIADVTNHPKRPKMRNDLMVGINPLVPSSLDEHCTAVGVSR
jgi:hypothetical protein